VIEKTGVNFKINSGVTALFSIDGTERSVSQNNILAFDRDYYIRIGNKLIDINLTVYSDKKDVFNKALIEFNKMLKNLMLK
jgi:hypothetical protein